MSIKNLVVNNFWITLSVTWCILIGILSLLPPSEVSKIHWFNIPGMDKILHALFYAFLALFAGNAIMDYLSTGIWRIRILVLTFCLIYGGLIEMIQPLTGRSKSILDFAADVAGTLLGTLLFYQLRMYKEKLFA